MARHGSDAFSVKEQQLEDWEEKLLQRSQALAESARTLPQKKAAVVPLLESVRQQGGKPPAQAQELLAADPLLASPHIAAAQEQAESARQTAIDARTRAAQIWESDLSRQAVALNAVIQGLAQAQKQLQGMLAELVERAKPEPIALTKPATEALNARPISVPPRGPENRLHDRARLRVQVDFESDHNFFTGFSADISEGGLFVATVNLQPLGAPVEVAFALPTGEQVVARGVVRWIRESSDRDVKVQAGMGIQFENLSEDARDAVHSFIAQREPMFYTD